jgi:glycosyltransferase involved in cell wall biosynthesis
VVATRIAGYAELLGDADCARLVEPGNPAALAAEIGALLGDPEQRRALGARGAAFARRYDWSTIARRIESIYAEALSRPGVRALA